MFKFIGCIFVTITSVFIANQRTLRNFYTYKFLKDISEAVEKLQHEGNKNLTYSEKFERMNFDWNKYITENSYNRYIVQNEVYTSKLFFENLGKRDNESENRYINFNLNSFIVKKDKYYKSYTETQKINLLCGLSAGLFISIILV